MSLLKIRQLGDPVLRQKSEPVSVIGDEEKKLAQDMIETMYFAEGVGLAANQIGVAKRMIVISPTNRRGEETVIFNPEISNQEGSATDREGCLSVPGVTESVRRFHRLTLKGLTLDGKSKIWNLEDFPAVVVQHEIDHINGILFIDYLKGWQKRRTGRLL